MWSTSRNVLSVSNIGNVQPFPKGWYLITESSQVRGSELLGFNVFGRDLVLGRDSGGTVWVVEDFCPHMGGRFSQGGKIVGDCVVCPFHGWQFDRRGACVAIPSGELIPDRAQIRIWDIRERVGRIEVFHGRRGEFADPAAQVYDSS